MTITEGVEFVETVLQEGWPNWKFTERAKGEWARRLWPFDFNKAKKAITDFAFGYSKPGRPPTGQIFAILHKNAKIPKEQDNSEPVALYNIIRPDGRPVCHNGFYSAKGVPSDVQAVQRGAEQLCARFADDEEGFYIQWLCEAVAPSTPF